MKLTFGFIFGSIFGLAVCLSHSALAQSVPLPEVTTDFHLLNKSIRPILQQNEAGIIQALTVKYNQDQLDPATDDFYVDPQVMRKFRIVADARSMLPGEEDIVTVHFDGIKDWLSFSEGNSYSYQSVRTKGSDGIISYSLNVTGRRESNPPASGHLLVLEGGSHGLPGLSSKNIVVQYSDDLCNVASPEELAKMGSKTKVRLWVTSTSKSLFGSFKDHQFYGEYSFSCGDQPFQVDSGLSFGDAYSATYQLFRLDSPIYKPDASVGEKVESGYAASGTTN